MEAEPRDRYIKNLYYPILIGEVLVERYLIEHKLGWGGFSTVWLAHDSHENKPVALKIMVPGAKGEREYHKQTEIIQKVNNISGLVIYQSMFYLTGHGGNKHMVLVFPVRGPSLYYCMRRGIWGPVARRVLAAKQLLISLKGLHDAGIIHRGRSTWAHRSRTPNRVPTRLTTDSSSDLNQGAVLYDMDPIETLTTAEEYKFFGRPRKIALDEVSWKRAELVEPMTFPADRIGNKVYLCDFGMCINTGTKVADKSQRPGMYCAPERFHDVDPSFASDMWSYMCIFVSLYNGGDPFWGEGALLMERVIGALGPFPAHWKGHHYLADVDMSGWYEPPNMDLWYDPETKVDPKKSLEEKIDRTRPEISEYERYHALNVMYKGFRYLPEERITAAELLEDESFNIIISLYGA